MGLFKSKPGGSFLGNMLRGAANKFSGGILGNGAMLAKATNDKPKKEQASFATMDALKGGIGVVMGDAIGGSTVAKQAIAEGLWAKYKTYILVAGAAIVGLVVYLTTKKKKRFGRR